MAQWPSGPRQGDSEVFGDSFLPEWVSDPAGAVGSPGLSWGGLRLRLRWRESSLSAGDCFRVSDTRLPRLLLH